jgi:hypothetical protein
MLSPSLLSGENFRRPRLNIRQRSVPPVAITRGAAGESGGKALAAAIRARAGDVRHHQIRCDGGAC